MPKLLKHENTDFQANAAWLLSNIAGGSDDQIQDIVDANLLSLLINLLESHDTNVQKQAIYAVGNIADAPNPETIKKIIDNDAVDLISNLLNSDDEEIIEVTIHTFGKMLKNAGKYFEDVYDDLKNSDMLSKINKLDSYGSTKISNLAYNFREAIAKKDVSGFGSNLCKINA
uniref:Uncharacterized protein n=1 Tax=Panagrolaimus sp. ES5 TaxID=591445 RepID=A0AC34G2C3_9BILA